MNEHYTTVLFLLYFAHNLLLESIKSMLFTPNILDTSSNSLEIDRFTLKCLSTKLKSNNDKNISLNSFQIQLPTPGKSILIHLPPSDPMLPPVTAVLQSPTPLLELPNLDYPLRLMFLWLGVDIVVQLLTCLLLENQVLLRSTGEQHSANLKASCSCFPIIRRLPKIDGRSGRSHFAFVSFRLASRLCSYFTGIIASFSGCACTFFNG